MNANHPAVIYCRVSSTKQSKLGDGLSSQETRCREYARFNRYDVVKVFSDDVSGGLIKRPGMQSMLAYLRKNKKKRPVVLIDDITRLARGIEAHLQLRRAIDSAGGQLESPSVEFGDSADAELQEYILATVSQHHRKKNAEQTKHRMRARTLNGYWVFQKPPGYEYKRIQGHGKLLVRCEPDASIIQEALEGFASGRFQLQSEVKWFLESFPDFSLNRRGSIHYARVNELLTRVVYAGYLEVPNWDVSLRPGHHEGLISMETFQKIQARLEEGAKVPARKDINKAFALRGAVVCGGV